MSDSNTEAVTTLQGGCLCGRVRYEARPTSLEGYYCHCRMCQLAFGNTRAAFFNLRQDAVRWTTEPPTLYASSRIAKRGFCNQCGTPLSFQFNDSNNMDLSVGSLDAPGTLHPISHFAIESRVVPWHVPDGLPEERLDEHVATLKRWRQTYGEDAQPGLATVREDTT